VTLQGSTLTIPAGALTTTQTITIESTTTAPPSGVKNLSPIYQFGPSGLVFAKPVTVELAFTSDGHTPVLEWSDLNAATFSVVPSTVAGGILSGQVTHFSEGFVADGTTTGTTGAPPPGDDAGVATMDATVSTGDAGQGTTGDDSGASSDGTILSSTDATTADDGSGAVEGGAPVDAAPDTGDAAGDYGVHCTHPGGSDPACVGTYDLCENYLNDTYCTKACSHPDGFSGLTNDPSECPPPTHEACTASGFCY
jgi:hypothetical protein